MAATDQPGTDLEIEDGAFAAYVSAPTDPPARPTRYDYGAVAFCYDELAALYSLGRIARSKQAFLAALSPGDSVLVAGAGRGADVLAAARAGAEVTAVDRSGAMLGRLRSAADREGLRISCVESSIETAALAARYDHVVAHYFLNCFAEPEARALLRVLVGRVRPGGRLHLADFAPARGGRLARIVTGLYYGAVNLAGWAVGVCALHPIPDLCAWLEAEGLPVEAATRFPIGPGPLPAYWSVTGRAPGAFIDPPGPSPGFA
jgi:ubiquinone/menaquinone biosynthesis C-methylase UbiE